MREETFCSFDFLGTILFEIAEKSINLLNTF